MRRVRMCVIVCMYVWVRVAPVLGGLSAGRGGHGAQADGAERGPERGAQRRRQRRGPPFARVLVQRAAPAELQRVASSRYAACNNIPPRSTLLLRRADALAQFCTLTMYKLELRSHSSISYYLQTNFWMRAHPYCLLLYISLIYYNFIIINSRNLNYYVHLRKSFLCKLREECSNYKSSMLNYIPYRNNK